MEYPINVNCLYDVKPIHKYIYIFELKKEMAVLILYGKILNIII